MPVFSRSLCSMLVGVVLTGAVLTASFAPQSALAQAGLGSLSGTVTDATHAVVAGATVTLVNTGTGFEKTVVSSSNGDFTFTALEVGGGYSIKVTATGFKTVELKNITTSVGTTITADVHLQVGASVDTVEVTASTNTEQVQTETSAISQVVDSTVWQDSPLETRSQNLFVTLVAGATPDSGTGRGASVDGARTGTGNFLVDGMDNNDQGLGGGGALGGVGGAVTTISPDAIQEYRVLTHTLPAEYGRTGGFATDTVLKSGTNSWHGSAFEYNRVQALAANSFFSNRAGVQDHLVRNQFGGSVGGPIYKDKTFFFTSLELHRLRQASPLTGLTTTADFLNFVDTGAFESFQEGTTGQNAALGEIGLCPAYTGTTCPGALSLSNKLGPIFKGLQAAEPTAFPLGTANPSNVAEGLYTGGVLNYPVPVYANYTIGVADQFNQNRGSMKIDHKLTERDQLSFTYLIDQFTDQNSNDGEGGGSIFGPAGGSFGGSQNFSSSWTHTFSPSLLNIFRAGYVRHVSNFPSPTKGVPEVAPAFDLNEGFGGSSGEPQFFTDNEFVYQDSITKTLAKHTIKAGFQMIRTRNGSVFNNDIAGTILPYDVENLLTDATLYDQFEPLIGGPAYGSLYYASASIDPTLNTLPDPYRGYRARELAAYVQDDWKATPRLVINAGLRWDYFGPPHNFKDGLDSNVYFGTFGAPTPNGNPFLPTAAIAGAEQGAQFVQKNSQIWNKDTKSFGPRLGFAYDVFGNGKFALRGGFGIGFDRLYNNVYENIRFNAPHFSDNLLGTLANGTPAGALLQPGIYTGETTLAYNQLVATAGAKPTPRHIDQRLRNAYYEQFDFGFEYELRKGYVLETNYVGTLGRQLVGLDNINDYGGRTACPTSGAPYAPTSACGEAGYVNGFTTGHTSTLFSNDNFRTNAFGSNYNGLQFSLRKGFSNGLQFSANYTYSKAMDQVSDVFSQRNGTSGPQDPYNPAGDYGPADFDLKHNVVITMNYTTKSSGHKLLLAGWSVSPIISLQSGTPFSPFDGNSGYNPIKDGRTGIDRTVYVGTGSPKNAITHSQSPATGYLKPNDQQDPTVTGGYFGPYTCPAGRVWCDVPIGRNSLTGPSNKNLDLGVSKKIALFDRQGFTIGGSFFNLFNHTNFSNPVADYNSSNYGRSLSAGSPRVIQLSGRFDF